MSILLPGLGLTAPTTQQPLQAPESRTFALAAGSEWRFEVAQDTSISVKLLPPSHTDSLAAATNGSSDSAGTAEIFGTELAPNRTYDFPGLTKAAVYTHYGCSLTVTGACESDYTAEETPMTEYTNLHFALENLRSGAAQGAGGPRVLVIGPKDSGKTTLIKTLTAYATRSGRTPLVVNLDPTEGMLCLAGSVSAAVMGTGALLDVEDAVAGGGWGSSPIGGPSAVPVKTPLVYQYGYAAPEERPEIFKPVATRLALAATSRFEEDAGVKEAGLLVDVAGSVCVGKGGYDILSHIVSEFSINVLLVLGSERLYSDMTKRFSSPPGSSADDQIHILRLPKSGGCADRDEAYMRQLRHAQIRAYFFGAPKSTLSPHTLSVDFDSFTVLRMVDPTSDDAQYSQLLPGTDDAPDPTTTNALFAPTAPSLSLQSALLALKAVDARGDSQEAIRDAPVVGYVYVADIEEGRRRVRVLSPVGGVLPRGTVACWGVWDGGLAVGVGGLVGG